MDKEIIELIKTNTELSYGFKTSAGAYTVGANVDAGTIDEKILIVSIKEDTTPYSAKKGALIGFLG